MGEEQLYISFQTEDIYLLQVAPAPWRDDVVRIDFNPQLAGETLQFDIEVVNVN